MRRQRKSGKAPLPGCDLTVGEREVNLRVCIERDGEIGAWLCLSYAARDPIVVDLSICSPEGAPVLERAVARADLRACLRRDIWLRGLRLRRVAADQALTVELSERRARITSTIPRSAVTGFLRACDQIVPPDREDAAVDEAIDRLLELSGCDMPRDRRAVHETDGGI